MKRWSENPYWQYFCGEIYFQHELPVNPSSLTRWRQRLGDKGMEVLLSATIEAAIDSKAVKARDLKRVTVDTTVQEKAIAFPTDSKLYNRARERLVRLAKTHRVPLRQSYVRVGPTAPVQEQPLWPCTTATPAAAHHRQAQNRVGAGIPGH